MSINALSGNYGVYTQPATATYPTDVATVNSDESIMSNKTKLKKTATTIGVIGAAVATLYAFKKGKASGNTGFKAITEGFKAMFNGLKGKVSGWLGKGKVNTQEAIKQATNVSKTTANPELKKAADALITAKAPQNTQKLAQEFAEQYATTGTKIFEEVGAANLKNIKTIKPELLSFLG